jgi:4'-phosphopantetheinyl transferase
VSAGWPSGPPRPPRPSGEVHLWIADLAAGGWPAADRLPAEERERAERLLRAGSATRWVGSRWALRTVLGRYLGEEPATIALAPTERGKPRLAEDPKRLDFNLSHSAELALIAVAVGCEVGVDIERIEPRRDLLALAERSFEPAAVAAVRAAGPVERPSVFYAAWARHEALAKCEGGGLGAPAHQAQMAAAPLDVGSGYAAALAVAGAKVPRLDKWSIEPPHAESAANLQR